MRVFCSRHPFLTRWLLADLVLLAAFWLFRRLPAVCAFLAAGATAFQRQMGRLCAAVPFSVMELLCGLLVLFAGGYLLLAAVQVVRARGRRISQACAWGLGALCTGLTIYVGFCFLWGVHYYTEPFPQRFGLEPAPVSVQELEDVTAYFARHLAESADSVPRDPEGRFAADRQEILKNSVHVYDRLEEDVPFLRYPDTPVKPVRCSRVMSALDFTGVYCPFTGESNVNMDAPACFLPSTAAHELAHQRSIASEQACNFLAVLSCTTCGDPVFAYSGWLKGYVHLSNALFRADPDRNQAIRDTLPLSVQADLADNHAYWDQFRHSAAMAVSNRVYGGFLKSYGVEEGLASYGMVVDLLVAYYKGRASSPS